MDLIVLSRIHRKKGKERRQRKEDKEKNSRKVINTVFKKDLRHPRFSLKREHSVCSSWTGLKSSPPHSILEMRKLKLREGK